jgi:hypothetical protein
MDDPPELTTQDMLEIRATIQRRLTRAYHEHLLLARALRRAGRVGPAAHEHREAIAYLDMLRSLVDPSDATTPPELTRLLEERP